MKRILITIPTFNAGQHITRCLESINQALAKTAPNTFQTEVAVIDDGSTDNTVELLKAFNDVKLISGTGDLWWSGSVNRGVAYARENRFDYLMLLNADNTLPDTFFRNAYNSITEHKQAVIGSQVLNEKGDIYFRGCNIDRMGQLHYIKSSEDVLTPCDIFGGMGVFVPLAVFDQVGVFDERNFPLYFGDTDFWLRCKRMGIVSFIDPGMQVFVDLKNTGIKRSNKGVFYILKNLLNIRFHANLKTVGKFYFKNFSFPRSLAAFILFYLNSVQTKK